LSVFCFFLKKKIKKPAISFYYMFLCLGGGGGAPNTYSYRHLYQDKSKPKYCVGALRAASHYLGFMS
ncbi:MAG: hypothetical protein ACK5C4_08175, partial [Pseudanabaena sp.]